MTSRSSLSRDNDQRGSVYQRLVGDHLTEQTGRKSIIKDTHGTDVINGELKLEVKGTISMFRVAKTKKRAYIRTRDWKTEPHRCPAEITHFAFVLDESHICTFPLIYVVPINSIRQRFEQYPHSQWVHFPFHWVWDHYDFSLSKIPLMEDTELIRKNILNSEKDEKK